jgi:hypothetical protein
VVAAPDAIKRLGGLDSKEVMLTFQQIRAIDFGATFSTPGSTATPWKMKRSPPLARAETLGGLLDRLPPDAAFIARLQVPTGADTEDVVRKVAASFEARGLQKTAMLSSSAPGVLRAAAERVPAFARALVIDSPVEIGATANELVAWMVEDPDALILPLGAILDDAGRWTALAAAIRAVHESGKLARGIIVRVEGTATLTPQRYERLGGAPFVAAISVSSTLDVAPVARRLRKLEEEAFAGERENSARFHFGYAKANRFAHVYQSDGVHLEIREYSGPPVVRPPTADTVANRLNELEEASWEALRTWPFYSGGGVGTSFGVDGDFIAQVDFRMENTTEATMCEMAVTNVDPGRHMTGWKLDSEGKPALGPDGGRIPNFPQSFRDKNAFFDPHGAPPFVGCEHDEDDGYRINYNLGTEYDNNQYGRPVGNGTTKAGRFRIERRGAYFASYYQDTENPGWVCSGTCRNDSMNARIFIRCCGKRWRQETSPPDPKQPFSPVVPNRFTFANIVISTVLDS